MSERTYAGYSADELRQMIQRGIPPTGVPMTGEMWQDYVAMYDAATAIPALLDHIASLEADNARLRGALEAVFNRLDDVPDSWAAAGVQARAIARNALEQEARDGE